MSAKTTETRRGRWVCPHDPTGIDPDTATYFPQKVWEAAEPPHDYGSPILDRMPGPARSAIENHCRLAGETMNPMFRRMDARGFSVVLTVNSGYE